jgi:hypothetical protein
MKQETYGEVIREIGSNVKNVAKSELELVIAEYKEASKDLTKHMTQAVIFGALLAISVLPLLAFLVIGLGDIMNGQYWLSSLIVAVICAVVGGTFAYGAYKKLTTEDLKFSHTKNSVDKIVRTTQKKVGEVKEAIT